MAGIGTGGTISGTGRYLKEVSDGRVQIIGADPEGSVYSGGSGRPYLVEGVGEDFWPTTYDKEICDRIVAVSDGDSFAMTRRLAREEALLVGGSCGMAAVAALRVAAELPADAVVVVLLPDGGRGYLGKVFNDSWMAGYGFLPPAPGATVGDVLRRKDGSMPELVHAHPNETVADAVHYLREFHVSQMPVVRAEPPVMAAEVAGAVVERRPAGRAVHRPGPAVGPAGAAHVPAAAHDRRRRAVGRGDVRVRRGRRRAGAGRRQAGRCGHPVRRARLPRQLTSAR